MASASKTEVIREYLRLVAEIRDAPLEEGWDCACYEDFILHYGYEFTLVVPDDLERGMPGNCFGNAAHYVVMHDGFHYCEGYATSHKLPLPIPHAWVVDDDGHAVDPTWRYAEGEASYFGVPLLRDAVWARLEKLRVHCIIFNDWEYNDHGLLRHGLPAEEIPPTYRKDHHG